MNLTVTLVIVTKDRFELAVETLLQVDLEAFDEVLVVDDSSDDRLADWCRDLPITHYDGPGINVQAARNVAIQECDTDIISFVDDDVLLPTDFGDRLRNTFRQHPEASAAGGPTLSSAPSRARNLCYRRRMTIGRITGTVYDDSYRWIPDEPTTVSFLKGANMSFRREALESIGGFDVHFGGASQREDTDACVRIRSHGEIVYDPSLRCYHKQTGQTGFDRRQIEWRFRNHRYFVEKNFGRAIVAAGLLSVFVRPCGNPDSIFQLLFRKFVLSQSISVIDCLSAYRDGIS
jgi:GT2 family glycosyltransferase